MGVTLGLCATTVVLAAAFLIPTSAGPVGAVAAPAKALTDAQLAAMTPAAQAALLNPLRDLADALSEVGGGAGADVFTNVEIDANHGLVNLYLTNTTRAAGIIQKAKSAHPSINTGLIRLRKATYTRAALNKARDGFVASKHSYEVYAVASAPDGSGLQIEVANTVTALAADRKDVAVKPADVAFALKATVAQVFVQGAPHMAVSESWDNVKWHDKTPFIGGDAITDGRDYCTTGLPAVRKSTGRHVMVTAAHCFGVGRRVYTGAGPKWVLSGALGNYVGTVESRNEHWDAELLVGASNNADVSDVNRWIPLTSVKYSKIGDLVCHSGFMSAALGHGTPCNIKVVNPDNTFFLKTSKPGAPVTGYYVRGVIGQDVSPSHWGTRPGDSGGTVWATTGTTRQARGILSGYLPGGVVYWSEAVDIFNAYGLKLNPVT